MLLNNNHTRAAAATLALALTAALAGCAAQGSSKPGGPYELTYEAVWAVDNGKGLANGMSPTRVFHTEGGTVLLFSESPVEADSGHNRIDYEEGVECDGTMHVTLYETEPDCRIEGMGVSDTLIAWFERTEGASDTSHVALKAMLWDRGSVFEEQEVVTVYEAALDSTAGEVALTDLGVYGDTVYFVEYDYSMHCDHLTEYRAGSGYRNRIMSWNFNPGEDGAPLHPMAFLNAKGPQILVGGVDDATPAFFLYHATERDKIQSPAEKLTPEAVYVADYDEVTDEFCVYYRDDGGVDRVAVFPMDGGPVWDFFTPGENGRLDLGCFIYDNGVAAFVVESEGGGRRAYAIDTAQAFDNYCENFFGGQDGGDLPVDPPVGGAQGCYWLDLEGESLRGLLLSAEDETEGDAPAPVIVTYVEFTNWL